MELFNSIFAQLKNYWNTASSPRRFVAIGTVALLVALVAGVAIWSSKPDYKLLRQGISPVLTAEIKSVLDTSGIPNKMNYSGTGVMVPTSRWNEANIAIANLGIPESTTATTSGNGFLLKAPGHQEQVASKELALERAISALQAIQSADVQLAVPKQSPFRRERQPASANVVVEAAPGQFISRELGANIVKMVAAGVEGLETKNVNLTGADGSFFSDPTSDDPATNRREYVRRIEAEKAMKAQELLTPILGPNRSVVRVTVEVDELIKDVTTKDEILVDQKATLSQKIISTDSKGAPATAGGVAGTGSNVGGGVGASRGEGSSQNIKSEETDVKYDFPRSRTQTTRVGGQVKRLYVSATIDASPKTPDDAQASQDGGAQPPLLTQEQAEDLIKRAVGFDQNRGDEINVMLTRFSQVPEIDTSNNIPETKKWEFVTEVARTSSLGIAALAALLIGGLTLRKLQPISVKQSDQNDRRKELLNQLSSRVDQNPEAVSKILAAWLDKRSEGGADETAPPLKQAA